MKFSLKESVSNKPWFSGIFVFVYTLIVFYGSRPFMKNFKFHSLPTALDNFIPFVPAFVYIYVLAFVQWAAFFIWLVMTERERCYRICGTDFIAKTIGLVCFLAFPTVMATRPQVLGSGFTNFVVKFIFSADAPNNLFPSFHCVESWLCVRVVFKSELPKWLKWTNLCLTMLIFASVLFIKQHYFLDIPAGILVAELSLFLGKKIKVEKVYFKANDFLKGSLKK